MLSSRHDMIGAHMVTCKRPTKGQVNQSASIDGEEFMRLRTCWQLMAAGEGASLFLSGVATGRLPMLQ